MFFEGFTLHEAGPIRMRQGGRGPALLLLHGHPQSHAMWHAVAPRLTTRFTVICPDLTPGRNEASLAADMLGLMTDLGHASFSVAGHDFGGHVGCHMALDAPTRIERLAVLEIVPVPQHIDRADLSFGLSDYPSCWFGQLHPKPEALITHAPNDWFRGDQDPDDRSFFHPEAVADYLCHQATLNRKQQRDGSGSGHAPDKLPSQAGHRRLLSCPVMVLYGRSGRIGGWYDPLLLWSDCVENTVCGGSIPAGHFLAEECPDLIASAFHDFFSPTATGSGQNPTAT